MLHGLTAFVEESGQYRIIYTCREQQKTILFIGDHKNYEKWFKKHG